MTSKTLMFFSGEREDDDSRGACVTFSTNELEQAARAYILKNESGDVVARLIVEPGANVREVLST